MEKEKLESCISVMEIGLDLESIFVNISQSYKDCFVDNIEPRRSVIQHLSAYFIIRLCVFRDELSVVRKEGANVIDSGTAEDIEKLDKLFEMYDFRNVRNWVLAHNRKRVGHKPRKEVIPTSKDLAEIHLPAGFNLFEDVMVCISAIIDSFSEDVRYELEAEEVIYEYETSENKDTLEYLDTLIARMENQRIRDEMRNDNSQIVN